MARDDEYDDERVVVVQRESASGVGMLLLGLAIGAGAALLFAPASGEETRERLQREARRAGRRMREASEAFGEELTERVGRTRSRIDSRVERARDAVGARVSAVGDAVEAGRGAVDQTRAELERAVADAKRAYAESRRAYREARVRVADASSESDDTDGTAAES